MPDFYDDIYEYLDKNEGRSAVNVKDQEELLYKICAHTGLDLNRSKIVLEAIFNEIRSNMLKGNKINLKGFGVFYIAGPKTGTKERIFAKFKPHKSFLLELNEEDSE